MRYIIGIFLFIFAQAAFSFDIYNSVSWEGHSNENGEKIQNYQKTRTFINSYGLKHLRLYYHDSFLTNGKPDSEKIKKIAILSQQNPEFPISFDIEMGDNFKPETVLPRVIRVLDLYHHHGGKAPVGVYALLPQNTYGGKHVLKNSKKFSELNKHYEIIAKKVDFLSPVFYNYDTTYELWRGSVDFGMMEAKKYAEKYNLKIIPYFSISYFVKDKNGDIDHIIPLGENETKERLSYLKQKGVNGVIIWDSNAYRLSNREKPVADIKRGWLKGVAEFIRE